MTRGVSTLQIWVRFPAAALGGRKILAAMGEFADGHTSSTKVEPSRVEHRVGKTFENIESTTRFSSNLELDITRNSCKF